MSACKASVVGHPGHCSKARKAKYTTALHSTAARANVHTGKCIVPLTTVVIMVVARASSAACFRKTLTVQHVQRGIEEASRRSNRSFHHQPGTVPWRWPVLYDVLSVRAAAACFFLYKRLIQDPQLRVLLAVDRKQDRSGRERSRRHLFTFDIDRPHTQPASAETETHGTAEPQESGNSRRHRTDEAAHGNSPPDGRGTNLKV